MGLAAGLGFIVGAAFTHVRPDEVREVYADFCDSVLKPLLHLLDPERAHDVAVWAASRGLWPKVCVCVCVHMESARYCQGRLFEPQFARHVWIPRLARQG